MKTIYLMNDEGSENPMTMFDDQWTLYSFNRRHVSYKPSHDFFPEGKISLGLRRKLAVGTAFLLEYSEHGPPCEWRVSGDCAESADGLLVWEHPVAEMGAKKYEDRKKDAANFCETYTAWCNGEVYGFRVTETLTLPCGHTG